MTMGVRVTRAVTVRVFVLVKNNFKLATKYVCDAAKRPQAGNVRAAFQA